MEQKIIKNNLVLLNLNNDELLSFLKMQIPAVIHFYDSINNRLKPEVSIALNERSSTEHLINTDVLGKVSYESLVKVLKESEDDNHRLSIFIDKNIARNQKQLISLIGKIRSDVYTSCCCINFLEKSNIFEVLHKPLSNGNPDKYYYYLANDTLLLFSENGPALITDNPKITSILDVIGK